MNIELRRQLGRQLADKRRERSLKQKELAQRLRISRPQLSDYETGKVVSPTFEVVLKAAQALDTEFVVAGYRITKDSPRRPEPKPTGREKQLTFSFYRGRCPRDATIRVTTLRTSVVIKASVAAGQV